MELKVNSDILEKSNDQAANIFKNRNSSIVEKFYCNYYSKFFYSFLRFFSIFISVFSFVNLIFLVKDNLIFGFWFSEEVLIWFVCSCLMAFVGVFMPQIRARARRKMERRIAWYTDIRIRRIFNSLKKFSPYTAIYEIKGCYISCHRESEAGKKLTWRSKIGKGVAVQDEYVTIFFRKILFFPAIIIPHDNKEIVKRTFVENGVEVFSVSDFYK